MTRPPPQARWIQLLSSSGMLLVLFLLCAVVSLLTLRYQARSGVGGAEALAEELTELASPASVVIVAGEGEDEKVFAACLASILEERRWIVREVLAGDSRLLRKAMLRLDKRGSRVAFIAASDMAGNLQVFANVAQDYPALGSPQLVTPPRYLFPDFLKPSNLLNVANQISVIAIVAIGMTLVIISGGIDLSVGSQVGLAAVVSCLLIQEWAGGVEADGGGIAGCCLLTMLLCSLLGLVSGLFITLCDLIPFIVTLSMLWIANGLALHLSGGESIYQVPAAFRDFAMGAHLFGIPNMVALMLLLYVLAHVVMAHTTLGRYLYAVGGNLEAARLSGVPVHKVRLVAYAASGLLAGLGGVILASQHISGTAHFGDKYELYVIAAVVVGGTSLFGGEGQIFGTLIGAFIIAVVQNGMNLLNISAFTQKIVLGLVLLAAVLLDRLKRWAWQAAG